MKLKADDPAIILFLEGRAGDMLFGANFPRLQFELVEEDSWRSVYAPGAVKHAQQL